MPPRRPSSRRSLLLLLQLQLFVGRTSAGPPLPAWRVAIDDSLTTGFVGERWGSTDTCKPFELDGLKVQGNNRLYAIQSFPETPGDWGSFEYLRLPLLNRQLQFDVDLSKVGCGCNAAVYLVAMPERPNEYNPAYCDIAGVGGNDACLEIDMLEGNGKALQATLHTTYTRGWDGKSCNADGCVANIGKTAETQRLYGPRPGPHGVNSSKPFTVTATFRAEDSGVVYDVQLTQTGAGGGAPGGSVHFFDSDGGVPIGSHVMANQPTPVPHADRERTRVALTKGMVLVISLWSSPPGELDWLDGGCDDWVAQGKARCTPDNLWGASMIVSGVRTSTVPSPPTPPPPATPPPPPPHPPTSPPPAFMGSPLTLVLYGLAFMLTIVATLHQLRMRAQRREADALELKAADRAIRRAHEAEDDDLDEDDVHMESVGRRARRGVSRI